MIKLLPLLLLLAVAAPTPETAMDHYLRAQKAVAARDFPAALNGFEAAIGMDADNLQYGSEYRQTVIKANQYDRSIAYFEKLVVAHPTAANAYLNYGFSYVDKVPAAGSITQVILANTALSYFTKSLEIKPSWIGYYTRGNSYLFWPKIFGRASLGVADLEAAMKLQKADSVKRSYHVRGYISLGDGYWKMDNIEKARAIWQEGMVLFPGNEQLKARLIREGDTLAEYIDGILDPNKRVDTNLHEIWSQ